MLHAPERLRTTSAQYGIWVAQLADEAGSSYWTSEIIELRGCADRSALIDSIRETLEYCQALHMRFEWDEDMLWQRPQPASTQVEAVDFSCEQDPSQAAQAWMRDALQRPCDVTCDALFRTALFDLSPTEVWWYLQVHHIVLDGFGYSLIQQTVAQRYNSRILQLPLPELPQWQIHRVVQAEVSYRQDGRFERDRCFWLEHLRQVPAPLQLAPHCELAAEPRRHRIELSEAEVSCLQQGALAAQCDWASWMLSLIGMWLGQRAGQRHFTLGLPVMNRMGSPAMGVPCMTMNIVPLSLHLRAENTLQDLVHATATQLRAMRPHLYYRYGWIRGDLGLIENGKPLFNQAVNLMPFNRQVVFTGLHSCMRPVSGGPVKDFNISLVVLDGIWQLTLEANANAYPAATAAQMAGDLHAWLGKMAQQCSAIVLGSLVPLLPKPSILKGAALSAHPEPVLERVRRMAIQQPRHPAIVQTGRACINYHNLVQQVGALASHLHTQGVEAGDVVSVLLPRSSDAVVAALAILWIGAIYAPVDPQSPVSRNALLLAEAAPVHAITHSASAEMLHQIAPALALTCMDAGTAWAGSNKPVAAAAPLGTAQQPAYLLHTSGSTGKPNGVLVGSGALAHYVSSAQQLFHITPQDRVLQFAPLHFDASLEEIFMTLCHGATLVLRDDAILDSARQFASSVQQQGVTVLDLPTAYWHTLAHALDADTADLMRQVRLTIIGGEAALPERVARWRELLPQHTLLDTYGPTEASIIATSAALTGPLAVWQPGQPVSIGLPRPGVDAVVLDERLYPVAQGRTGELALCGEALAQGYMHQPDLTNKRFVTLPDSGVRAYRTGDLVRWHNGLLHFQGRTDSEVKISGLRIDPAEVENALLGLAHVREVAVVPLQNRCGHGAMLAAFIAADQPGKLNENQSRHALAQMLPAQAVPSVWLLLNALPRNANGKIDRKRLPALLPKIPDIPLNVNGTDLEQTIAQAWKEVLGEETPLNAEAHFFELGGKSLQAIQVASSLSHRLQRDVAVSLLFRHPTFSRLARALRAPQAYLPPRKQDPFTPLLTLQSAASAHNTVATALPAALFCFHPADGLAWSYLRLAPHLPGVPMYGLQMDVAQSRQANDFDALAATYVQRIRSVQPEGPYRLLGWSLGGALAYAVATQLQQTGEPVALLALLDSYPPFAWRDQPMPTLTYALQTLLEANGDFDSEGLAETDLYQRLLRPGSPFATLGYECLQQRAHEAWRQMKLFRQSVPQPYVGKVHLFQAMRNPPSMPQPASWHDWIAPQNLHREALDCTHNAISDPAPMAAIAAGIKRWFAG